MASEGLLPPTPPSHREGGRPLDRLDVFGERLLDAGEAHGGHFIYNAL